MSARRGTSRSACRAMRRSARTTAESLRMIADTASLEFVTTATEIEALLLEANLIKRLKPRYNVVLRDDKSFPFILIARDHPVPQILKHRGARGRKGDYFGPFASAGAVNRTINDAAARLPAALLLRPVFRQPRSDPACSSRSSGAARPASARSPSRSMARWSTRRWASCAARATRCKLRLHALMEAASLDAGLRACRELPRPDPRALPHPVAPGHQPGEREGGRRVRRASGRRARPAFRCSSSATATIGATAPISPRRQEPAGRGGARRRSSAVLRRQAAAQAGPAEPRDRRAPPARGGAVAARRAQGRREPARARRAARAHRACAHQCARGAGAAAGGERHRRPQLLRRRGRAASISTSAPERIEVYDNSHISGTNAVGAMIVAGPDGFIKGAIPQVQHRRARTSRRATTTP